MNKNEYGGVFFYILIAIVLLAALTFAINRDNRSSTSTVTTQQAKLAAQEAIEHGDLVKNAFQKLLLRGFEATDISFENNIVAGYTLSTCATDDCKIFEVNGGSLNWIKASNTANGGTNWIYSGVSSILDNGANARSDIVMILPGVTEEVCRNINFTLGVTANISDAPPVTDDTTITTQQLKDTFPIAESANVFDGANITGNDAVCVQIGTMSGAYAGTNEYHYVHTIYAG